jgi:hypothetical protein
MQGVARPRNREKVPSLRTMPMNRLDQHREAFHVHLELVE